MSKSKSHCLEEKALDERLTEARDNLLALKRMTNRGHEKLSRGDRGCQEEKEEARRMRCEREVRQEFLKKVVQNRHIEQCEDIEKRTSTSLINFKLKEAFGDQVDN